MAQQTTELLGEALLRTKEQLLHDQWTPQPKAHGVARGTARRFIPVAAKAP